jgi:integrase/recombinase XerD
MAGWSGVSVSGPLEEFAEGFRVELARLGYSAGASERQRGLMKHVSAWLAAQGLAAGDLTGEVAGRFVAARGRSHRSLRSSRALVPLLGYLRSRGAIPAVAAVAAAEPADVLLGRFAGYLASERGLAAATVRSYVSQVRPFVLAHDGGWGALSGRQVAVFVTERARLVGPRSAAVGANALRCLLRWMWREGLVSSSSLAAAVGKFAAATASVPRRALSRGELAALVGGLPAGPVRLRNEAMLALMWRLGLRAGEVAALELGDIDWRAGVLLVRGKRRRLDHVPLPVDVGELLAGYLSRGRPRAGAHREVFLALDAPHGPLGSAAVSSVAGRALAGAGIAGRGGAHRLRHTAACGVLSGGGGLVEVGQLLRHSSPAASAVYARSDDATLAVLARPWPIAVTR